MRRRPGIFRMPRRGPFDGILAEPLADNWEAADIAARFAALFERYGIAPPGFIDGWPFEGQWLDLPEKRAPSPWDRLAHYGIAPPGFVDGWPFEGQWTGRSEKRAPSPWERLARELAV